MAAIATGNFAQAIWPGINAWYGNAYAEWPQEYDKIFMVEKSNKHHEEDALFSGFGLMSIKGEGSPVSYDTARQGYTTRYTHDTYGLGFVITREMYEDDLYGVIGKKKARAMARSVRQTKETVCANVLNRGFNTSYLGGDGKELFATDHPNVSGGTFQNELSTAADLSEAALEQALIDIGKWTDDRGLKAAVRVKRMIVPVDLEWEACRLLETEMRVDTANNDISAIYKKGAVPEGYHVNHYLTDTDAWFLVTDVDDGLKMFERRADEFTVDNDFDTDNAKYKATSRYVPGWSDPRGAYASPGA